MTGPTLLGSCAKAATTAETRYRVDYPNSKARVTRIIALDRAAAEIMRHVAEEPWNGARFLSYAGKASAPGFESLAVDAVLTEPGGTRTMLSEELRGADVVVMIASAGEGEDAASVIGNACLVRSIMTAGLIVADESRRDHVEEAVKGLRPFASVLVVAASADYVPDMLAALRA